METPGSAPGTSQKEVLGAFSPGEQPGTPLTTTEVADRLDCQETTAKDKLEILTKRGDLHSRQIDASTRIWWPTTNAEPKTGTTDEQVAQFQNFIDAVKDYAIFTLDPEGHVNSWNEGAERIKGYDEVDILGQHFSTFYTEEDGANDVPEKNLTAAKQQGRVEDEGWRVKKDGSRFWAHVVITAIRDDNGTLQGFTKVTRDMTDRREYEQQLRAERDLSEQILETVPLSITVVTPDGEFQRANSRALHRLGITDEELDQYTASSWSLYEADGEPIPDAETPWVKAAKSGSTISDFRCQVDLPEIGRRWLSINAAPCDFDDSDKQIILSIEDITERVERERVLERERNQTEELLRTAPVAIAVQNTSGETLLANDRAQDILGLSEREIIEEPDDIDDWNIYNADGKLLSQDETPTSRVYTTGKPVFEEEIAIENPNGERKWLSINATPVSDQDGDFDRVIIAGENVTQLKRREQQLEQRKSQLETELGDILGRVSDAFYALDEDWCFTHVNEQAEELLQHSSEDLLEERIWEMFPEATDTIIWDRFHVAMNSQEQVSFEYEYDELDMWIEINAYPSETGLSVYFQDITERKERERELAEQRVRYRRLVEVAPVAIVTYDADGHLTFANTAAVELAGVPTADELLDEPALEFIHPDDRPETAERMQTVIEKREAVPPKETTLVLPTGEQRHVIIESTPIRHADEPAGQVVLTDITERKKRELELERYEWAVETVWDGITVLDSDDRFVMVNEAFCDMTGYDRDEVIGEPATLILDSSTYEEAGELHDEVVEGDRDIATLEYDLLTAHGRTVPVEARFGPVEYADGTKGGAGVIRDITERREHERELERALDLLERTEHIADVGGWEIDTDTQEVFWTEHLFDLLEVPADEEPPLNEALNVYHEDDQSTIENAVEGALGAGEPFDVEARFRTDSGEIRWLRVQGAPEIVDGDVVSLRGAAQDITERKRRERALEESERRHRTLVEHFPDGAVGMFDNDLRYTAIGGQLLDQVGLTPEDRIGKHISEAYPEEIVEEYGHYFQAVFEGEAHAFESVFHDRNLFNQTVPVRNADGDVYAGMLVAQDITERKERERELEQYETIIESLNEGVYVVDADRDFQWVNEAYAEMLGYTREELIGENASMVVADENVIREAEAIEEKHGIGEVPRMDVELVTKSGGRVPVDAAATLLPEGKEDGWLRAGVVRDITEQIEYQNRLEEIVGELEESNERLEQFAYIASHDLQEPLRMISSHLQLLEDRYRDELDADAEEFIEFAVDGAERMQTMVKALLAYSRLDMEAEPLEPTDSENVVDNVLDQLQLQIEENDAAVIVEDLPIVEADENQLEQVFQNLISNAIKYRDDESPRIEIGADRQGDMCRFQVTDNGIGINPAYTEQIFEVFKRLHSNKDYPGTGIGLALCKKIVERHDGEIWVESETEEGSTFYFTIPIENHEVE